MSNKVKNKRVPKTIKSFLLQLKALTEETYLSEMQDSAKLTRTDELYLHGIISGIQNELGDMDSTIWDKFKVTPYDGSGKEC